RVVGAEQALVAVGADEELGGDVAEEAEDARAVDEAAAVVRVVRGQAEPEARLHADLPSLRAMSASTMKLATWAGLVPGPKPASKPSSRASAWSMRGPPRRNSTSRRPDFLASSMSSRELSLCTSRWVMICETRIASARRSCALVRRMALS